MGSSNPGRRTWAWSWAGACFASLACGLLAPGAARASCDHHGRPGGSPAGDVAHFDRLAQAGAIPTPSGDAPEPPTRCSGPTCSGNVPAPLAPAPPAPPRAETWGVLMDDSSPAGSRPAARPDGEEAVRPSWSGPSIFHPPRPSLLGIAA